jgi:spore germination protein YaaH
MQQPMLISQEHPSIHQIEYEKYKDLPKELSRFDPSGKDIIPLNAFKNPTPDVAVFGYFPYWKYPESIEDMQFDLLSHIAVFDFSVLSNGNLSPPSAWPWTDLINEAHENNVKVILTAVNFNTSQIHQLLNDSSIKANFFQQIKNALQTYELQGVNIDFENISSADRGEVLNGFMADLKTYLHTEMPGSEVSIAIPPINWGGWQFTGLAEACDYMFIMGYNFYGSWSETSGACAPLTGGSYNLTNSLLYHLWEVAANYPKKLILGIPYYGNRWQTEDGDAYSLAIDHTNQPTYSIAKNTSDVYGELWDEVSQTPYCSYLESNNWYQVWYDSDSSLGLKFDLAESYDLKGIGMWALGYDSDKPELWDEIRRRYEASSSVEELAGHTLDIRVSNNANGRLKVEFELKEQASVSILLSNISGQIVLQNNYGRMSNGRQLIQIPVELIGGIYILKLFSESDTDFKNATRKIFVK